MGRSNIARRRARSIFDSSTAKSPSSRRSGAKSKNHLVIQADLGILPYSLEVREKRDRLLDCLALLDQATPGVIVLNRHKRIAHRDEVEIPRALSPVNILAYLTGLLLNAGPYLELPSEPLALGPQSPGEDETLPTEAPETP